MTEARLINTRNHRHTRSLTNSTGKPAVDPQTVVNNIRSARKTVQGTAVAAPLPDLAQLLSPHFTLREFVRSGAAVRHKIENTPQPVHIARLRALCQQTLEPLRRRFGVIRITSGYRCPKLNAIVGGAETSQHTLGEAADIHVGGRETGEKMFAYVQSEHIPFDQMILEHSRSRAAYWLHISLRSDRPGNRRDAMHIEKR